MRSIFIITKLTIREASRRKILWAALILGLLFLIIYGLGFHFARLDLEKNMQQRSGMNVVMLHELHNFLLLAGLYSVNFMIIAMSALISVDTLSGEINSGTIQTLVTKPLLRWQIVIGKWLGFGFMLTLYLIFMVGGTMGLVYASSGYLAPHSSQGLALIWLNGMLFLSLSLCGGAFFSTLANGVVAFGLFGVAFVGGGMGRAITPEEKAAVKQKLEAAGFLNRCKKTITPVMMQETLESAGIRHYKIMSDGPGDSGCKCGMWIEIRKMPG